MKRVWCMSSDFLGLTGCSRSCDYQNALGMVMYYYLEVRESSNNIMLCTRMQVWPHLTFLCLCIMKSHALYMHGESDWCARNQNCYASKPPKIHDVPRSPLLPEGGDCVTFRSTYTYNVPPHLLYGDWYSIMLLDDYMCVHVYDIFMTFGSVWTEPCFN